MNRIAVLVAATFCLSASLPAVQIPQPVETGQEAEYFIHRTTGLIEAATSWGSGVVVEHPRVVLSCAHVVYEDFYRQWTSGARWYRAYNGDTIPDPVTSQSLNGYFYWRSYASASQAALRASDRNFPRAVAAMFNLDAIAYFSYADDLGGGEQARVLTDGAARLGANTTKWITGYPGGRYSEGDPREYRLHLTGGFNSPLLPEFRPLKNYVTSYYVAETGSGNSGGPVWTTDTDGVPAVAGILVSGAEQATDNDSWIGVHATSAQSRALVSAAVRTADEGSLAVTQSFIIAPDGAIPDAITRRVRGRDVTRPGDLVRTFRVRGLPKSISSVKVSLVVEHGQRQDLDVTLLTPGKKRLPVYDGLSDASGTDVVMNEEEAPLFYGLNPNGTWVLRIRDWAPADTGQLVSATVQITAR
jgi:hypothetical protein